MTQFIVGLNAALMAVIAGVQFIDLSEGVKALVSLGCTVAVAFLSAYLPKVSAATRRFTKMSPR